jgi:hypothetical protein
VLVIVQVPGWSDEVKNRVSVNILHALEPLADPKAGDVVVQFMVQMTTTPEVGL